MMGAGGDRSSGLAVEGLMIAAKNPYGPAEGTYTCNLSNLIHSDGQYPWARSPRP